MFLKATDKYPCLTYYLSNISVKMLLKWIEANEQYTRGTLTAITIRCCNVYYIVNTSSLLVPIHFPRI